MKKREPDRRKRFVAISLTLVMAISEFTGMTAPANAAEDIAVTFEDFDSHDDSNNADEISFAVDSHDDDTCDHSQDDKDKNDCVYIGYKSCELTDSFSNFTNEDGYEYPMFPMEYLNVSNNEDGHSGRKCIDICGKDSGIDCFYAPFSGRIVRCGFGAEANNVVIESSDKVVLSDGSIDYINIWLAHDNDIDDLYEGMTFSQGDIIYHEGTKGNASGNHVHMATARGKYEGLLDLGNKGWTLKNEYSAYNIFWLQPDMPDYKILNTGGYAWKKIDGNGPFVPDPVPSNDYKPLVDGKRYYITNEMSGYSLEVPSGSNEEGHDLSVWPVTKPGDRWQSWIVREKADGYLFENAYTGKALDVEGASLSNGIPIQQYTVHNGVAQVFRLVDKGKGKCGIININSGKAVEVYGNDGSKGARVKQYTFHGGDNQLWIFEPADNGIELCGVSEGDTYSGITKFRARRFEGDSNHYLYFYIDDDRVSGMLSADKNGYFSVEVDTKKYSNGNHQLRCYYANSLAGWSDTKTIKIENKHYKLFLDPNGGAFSDGGTQKITVPDDLIQGDKSGSSISNYVPTRDGYEFEAWYDEPEGGKIIYDASGKSVNDGEYWNTVYVGDQNLTVFAHWKKIGIKVSEIRLDKSTHSMLIGQEFALTATILPEDATEKGISWNSSDTGVATVSSEGVVTARGVGRTIITAQTMDGNHKAVCEVMVSDNAPPVVVDPSDDDEVLPTDTPDVEEVPDNIWLAGVKNLTYDGTKQTQEFRVYDGTKQLIEKTDYSITYKNNQNAYHVANPSQPTTGDIKYAPQIILTMKGDYSGKETAYFSIEPLSIEDSGAFTAYLKQSGSRKTPVVTWNGKTLKENVDYTVFASDTTFTITGKGNFQGTRTLNAGSDSAIPVQINMSKVKVSPIPTQIYKGSEFTLEDLKTKEGDLPFSFSVSYGTESLAADTDYCVAKVLNATQTGTATVVLRGLNAGGTEGASINSFVGEKRVTFKITGYPMLGADISVTGEDGSETLTAPYCKAGVKPALMVRFGETVLKEGRDYTLKYTGNTKYPSTNAGVVIQGKGNFAGKKTVPFSVTQRPFSDDAGITVVAGDKAVGKKANQYRTSVKVFDAEGKLLKAGTDYEKEIAYLQDGRPLSAASFPQAGERVTVRVTGKGGYSGDSIDAEYTILAAGAVTDIAKATIQINDQQYDKGRAIEITSPDQIKLAYIGKNKTRLTLSSDGGATGDFMVVPGSYVKNASRGTASVTFMGINGYSGAKTVKFKIGARSIIGNWFGWLF